MNAKSRSSFLNVCLLLTWTAAIGYGMYKMWLYDATPGVRAKSADWPSAVGSIDPRLQLAGAGEDTLVMLAHSRCPCTRAGVENLAHIMTVTKGRIRAFVVVYEPSSDDGAAWTQSALVQDTLRIPGVTTLMDPHGAITARFNGRTSGQTFVFDSTGHLLFNGGLTSERGMAGDCAGSDAVTSLVLTGSAAVHTTPVYGCSLVDLDRGNDSSYGT